MSANEPLQPRSERRRAARARQRVVIGGGIGVVVIIGVVLALVLGSGSGVQAKATVHRQRVTVSSSTTTTTTATPPSVLATTKVPQLRVYQAADDHSALVTTLSNKTSYGSPRTLLVVGQQPGWVHALLPIRPNGAEGWVHDTDVTIASTTYAISISISNHSLVLANAGVPVITTKVAVGKAATPTPPGTFFVTDLFDLTANPHGAYGAYALALSGFSEVLQHFMGGPGQLGVHGIVSETDPGQNITNGCVRLDNNLVTQIGRMIPLGTPVTITA